MRSHKSKKVIPHYLLLRDIPKQKLYYAKYTTLFRELLFTLVRFYECFFVAEDFFLRVAAD